MQKKPALPLRASQEELATARKSFIQQHEATAQFEKDCAEIIPVLLQEWEAADIGPAPDFRHYLFNYSPQLLTKALRRTRKYVWEGPREVRDILAYYKAVVRDLRTKELAKQKNTAIDWTDKLAVEDLD